MDRLLIVGSGDIAWRALPWLRQRFRVYALVRRPESIERWRTAGALPVSADLDVKGSLKRLAGLAEVLLWCAPPAGRGDYDRRLLLALAALARARAVPQRIVYVSTSGVYGDCQGARVTEMYKPHPQTSRALRRLAAEVCLRGFAIRHGCDLRILRAPGIYAADRLGLDRLRRQDPVLCADEDVMTNHIHADDLAHAVKLALFHGGTLRVFNVCDDSHLSMGDYYDAMADIFELPRPPRVGWAECAARLSPMSLSFMAESRCLDNSRIKRELRWRPIYSNVHEGLLAARVQQQQG
jgi:nucleoside-diphosphate-sugar epimerase